MPDWLILTDLIVPFNGLPWESCPGPNSGTIIAPVPVPVSETRILGGEL